MCCRCHKKNTNRIKDVVRPLTALQLLVEKQALGRPDVVYPTAPGVFLNLIMASKLDNTDYITPAR